MSSPAARRPDVPEILRRVAHEHREGALDLERASYFLSQVAPYRGPEPAMTAWRKHLFIAIARSAASEGDYLRLPEARTVILRAKVPI